jgi:hypothetical protein
MTIDNSPEINTEDEEIEDDCEHGDRMDGHCCWCGQEIGMSYNYEHDSRNMER